MVSAEVKEEAKEEWTEEAIQQKCDEREEIEKVKTIEDVVKKAQFLVMMQTPPNFKSAEGDKGWELAGEMSKKPSYYEKKDEESQWKDTFREWKEGLAVDGQIRTEASVKQDLLNAGTESILACL